MLILDLVVVIIVYPQPEATRTMLPVQAIVGNLPLRHLLRPARIGRIEWLIEFAICSTRGIWRYQVFDPALAFDIDQTVFEGEHHGRADAHEVLVTCNTLWDVLMSRLEDLAESGKTNLEQLKMCKRFGEHSCFYV